MLAAGLTTVIFSQFVVIGALGGVEGLDFGFLEFSKTVGIEVLSLTDSLEVSEEQAAHVLHL